MYPPDEPRPELCEACETNKPIAYWKRLWLCDACLAEQKQVIIDIKTSMAEKEGMNHADYMEKIRGYDATLKLREDIFNSESASITQIIDLITEDDRIKDKNFAICQAVKEKIEKLRILIFDENTRIIELNNRLRVNEQYLNEKANSLRKEERDKLKLLDNTYKIEPIKIGKPKLVSVKKKVDKELVKKCVAEINNEFPKMGITEVVFQMIMVQKGRGPEDTLFDLRRKFKEMASEVSSANNQIQE